MKKAHVSLLVLALLSLAAACGGGKPANGACGGCGCGGEVDAAKVTEPDGWKANTDGLSDADLLAKGLELWKDTSLSANGNSSCNSCHGTATAQYKESFAKPYPHEVAMAKEKSGKAKVTTAEMVQLCMVIPMANDPLAWDDVKLAALARAVEEKQKEYKEATGK